MNILTNFLAPQQAKVLKDLIKGEEGLFFAEKVQQLEYKIKTMPQTYETDGQGDKAIAHLHYFIGGCDWYITEKDMEDEQHQAFGLASIQEVELGYISIEELKTNNVEIDLHFEPTTIGELKKKLK